MSVAHRTGILFTFWVTVAGCSGIEPSLPFFNTADFTPIWIEKSDTNYALIHTIPAFTFVDQEGDTVTEQALEGKITVSDFFFTICPGICPRLTKSMGTVQNAFQGDSSVLLLSLSVTPDLDSIPRLKAYAETHHVQHKQWHLLTGVRSEIYSIARQGYFADEVTGMKKGPNDFLHTENFILTDKQRRIRGVYNGTSPTEVERLIEDIKILQHEI